MPTLRYNLDEIKSFQIKPGTYRLKLIKVEQTLSSKKNPQLVWTWKIMSGSEKGKTLRSWTPLQENALSNLKTHLEAFGFAGKIATKTEKLIGRTIIAVVSDRVVTDQKTKVDKIYPSIISMRPDKKARQEEEMEDEEDETEDEEEEEETPRPKKKSSAKKFVATKKSRRPVEEEDEEDEEDLDDEDEEDLDDEDEDEDLPF